MEKKTIIIHDSENPLKGLQKLLGGFCQPKKSDQSDDDTMTEGTHISEPDVASQVNVEDEEEELVQDETKEKLQEQEYFLPEEQSRTEEPQEEHREEPLHEEPQQEENRQEEPLPEKLEQLKVSSVVMELEEEDEIEEVTLRDQIKETENPPEIKVTNLDRRKRVHRGLSVAMMAFLVVFSTLFTLHRLGYELADFTYKSSDKTKNASTEPFIKIRFNEKKFQSDDKLQHTMEHSKAITDNKLVQVEGNGVARTEEKLEVRALVDDIQNGSEL